MRTRSNHRGSPARAFTLLEVLLVVVILTVMAALLFVAIGAAVRTVRRSAEQQYVRSLATAIEQYKQSAGVVPPLVADGPGDADGPLVITPVAGQPARPRFKGENNGDLAPVVRFLRYETDTTAGNRARFSEYTLSIYILGVLGKKYDGVDGPGFTKPDSDGVFARAGSVTQPLFDTSRHPERVIRDPRVSDPVGSEDDRAARTLLVDRWGTPIRYYAWLPTYHKTGAGLASTFSYPTPPANNAALAKEIRCYNIPPGVGNPVSTPELRSAKAAVVSAGPDRLINDTDPDAAENQDNIVEVIQ